MALSSGDLRSRPAPSALGLPIVGIGCSAGGLDATERFLSSVPADSGMAFVLIQHLSSDHAGALAELLRPVTRMTVVPVSDGMVVEANVVYVVPPDKDVSIHHGMLSLAPAFERHGMRLPIDAFFRSLAEDRQQDAIGVVLSGLEADGVAGLGAIRERAGLALIQDPAGAQSDGIPRVVIAAGGVDIVARPEDMPALIAAYLKHPIRARPGDAAAEALIQGKLDEIITLLRRHGGNDYSLYKRTVLIRRIERRIALNQIANLADYQTYLLGNPHELDLLSRELLIGVTAFFRDPEVWEELERTTIPEILARRSDGAAVRAWVPGCSTGEEAYSLAILFREAMERSKSADRVKVLIYASDLDHEAVILARKGCYSGAIAATMSPERLAQFFVEDDGKYHVCKKIRNMVVFAHHNIIVDTPFSKLDFISCRNLLIYFNDALRAKLMPIFSYALNSGGTLLLGGSESAGPPASLFAPVGGAAHLFRRLDPPAPEVKPHPGATPGRSDETASMPPRAVVLDSFATLTDQLIQQTYAPPAVLISGSGDLLYISGQIGPYLEPAAGKVNLNIHAMARGALRTVLPGLIRRAQQQGGTIRGEDVEIKINGTMQVVAVTVQLIDSPESLRDRLLVVFQNVVRPESAAKGPVMAALARNGHAWELLEARDALLVMREEMRSSVNELTSSNEDLQSANEELMTAKEEVQAMNEELQAILVERQAKIDSLISAQNDTENLLNCMDVATIFLDGGMHLRRYTPSATKLFKLMPADVGRPLSDMVSVLDYPHLVDDVEAVLGSETFKEREADARDGQRYRVRISPYRTKDNSIDGVVITFANIRNLEASATMYRH
ncbi:chemotaxis protein CheB [Magnetospirillum moscoviense]|nr:chemotaxis protein CheB [Magnetospirillum moscoviense]